MADKAIFSKCLTMKPLQNLLLSALYSYDLVTITINIAPRHEVRLNDVNWSLIATLLLGNSGYQTDRKIYDHSTPLAILAQSARCGRYKTINLLCEKLNLKKEERWWKE